METATQRVPSGPSHITPMTVHPVRFLWMNRSTHSDVMATSTTTEITALGGATKLPSSNGSLQIQLPSFLGKHLPSHVSKPNKQKAKALIKGKYNSDAVSNVAVLIVRIVFISAFLFCCLLLNHSFPTNPNKSTN